MRRGQPLELERPLRADARRNRERLLAAAEEVFSSEGVGAPVDEIARRAGLGVGTLYRHFPTKEALFEAIVVGHLERFLEEARRRESSEDPAADFFELVRSIGSQAAAKRDLADALALAGVDLESLHAERFAELQARLGRLLARAQEAGAVRKDVGVHEVIALVSGACKATDASGRSCAVAPLLAVVCDGLRSRGSAGRG